MAKSNADRQREYMARLKVRAGALGASPVAAADPSRDVRLMALVERLFAERKLNMMARRELLDALKDG